LLGVWLGLSVAVCIVSGRGLGYYLLIAFPPLAFIVGDWISQKAVVSPAWAIMVLVPLVIHSSFTGVNSRGYDVDEPARKTGKVIASRASQGDEVLVWGRAPQVNVYSGLLPAATRAAMFSHAFFLPGELETVKETVHSTPPRFVVLSTDLPGNLRAPGWLQELLASSYLESGEFSGNSGITLTLFERRS